LTDDGGTLDRNMTEFSELASPSFRAALSSIGEITLVRAPFIVTAPTQSVPARVAKAACLAELKPSGARRASAGDRP
jgi:hypothetical protein